MVNTQSTIQPIKLPSSTTIVPTASLGGESDFATLVVQMFNQLEKSTSDSREVVEAYAKSPDSVSLERMALLMNKAESDIRVATQVRNRMVSAYQDVINMQV